MNQFLIFLSGVVLGAGVVWVILKDEIERTDRKIDEEIYNLYGLTPEEIKIVEGNNK